MKKSRYSQETRIILAKFDEKTIRVYQAYNDHIADEAIDLGTFGPSLKVDRMTWIKPSFLWMMYRAGWGTKKDQERVLAIDISREGFDEILSKAILSNFNSGVYPSYDEWKENLQKSEVRCQWDPDRDIYGNPLNRRAIQLGLRDGMVEKYINRWIVNITDISDDVHEWGAELQGRGFTPDILPKEKEYPIDDEIKKLLGIF
jgi:hypothetical protein